DGVRARFQLRIGQHAVVARVAAQAPRAGAAHGDLLAALGRHARQDRGDVAAFVHARMVPRAPAGSPDRLPAGREEAMASGWLATSRRGMAELRRRRVLRALGAYVVGGWVLLQVANTVAEPLGITL